MERACFDYVRAASEDPTSVPDEVLQRLKQHLTPPQIIELACVVGFWKFYNTVHDSLHIPVESHAAGRYRICRPLGCAAHAPARQVAAPASRQRSGAASSLPATVSRSALLDGGSDQRFRALVNDLLTIAARMEAVREHHRPPHRHQRAAIQRADRGRASAGRHRRQRRRGGAGDARVERIRRLGDRQARARSACCSSGPIPQDRRGVLLRLAPGGRLKVDRMHDRAAGDQRPVLWCARQQVFRRALHCGGRVGRGLARRFGIRVRGRGTAGLGAATRLG